MSQLLQINIKDRFFKKVRFNENNWCWEWKGSVVETGYGIFCLNGKNTYAHRIGYEMFKGKIPTGLQVNHLCRNRSCVNSEHLEAVTRSENMLYTRKKFNGKSYCKNGHELSIMNIDKWSLNNGTRQCRICRNEGQNKRNMKKETLGANFAEESEINIEQFINECSEKYGKSTFKAAIKLKLLEVGVNVYRPNIKSAKKYIDKALKQKAISLKDIMKFYEFKVQYGKLRKKLDGVLIENSKLEKPAQPTIIEATPNE